MEITNDVLRSEVLPRMKLKDILSFCQVNQETSRLCHDDRFWQQLVYQHYKRDYSWKPIRMSWREYYTDLDQAPFVSFYFGLKEFAKERLNPHWIDLEKVQEIILDHGMDHHPIVFTDEFITPIAFFDHVQLYYLQPARIRKVVIYPKNQPLSETGVLETITTDYYGTNPIYGYLDTSGQLWVGDQPIHNLSELARCDNYNEDEQKLIRWILNLQPYQNFCHDLRERLIQTNRIINI